MTIRVTVYRPKDTPRLTMRRRRLASFCNGLRGGTCVSPVSFRGQLTTKPREMPRTQVDRNVRVMRGCQPFPPMIHFAAVPNDHYAAPKGAAG